MTKTLAFLHTAQANADLFEAMAQDALPLEHSHAVRADLLARAVDAGELTPRRPAGNRDGAARACKGGRRGGPDLFDAGAGVGCNHRSCR